MARKYAWLLVLLAVAVPAVAGGNSGSISGYVKNSSGTPQMGAVVEVFGPSGAPIATAFTDARGYYEAPVAAGMYYVKVSAPSFLPALRDGVDLRTGAATVLNFTLNTLFEAFQIGGVRKASSEDEEDWKWTLRSMSNRPVLRIVEGSPVIVTHAENPNEGILTARVAFIAGSDGSGSGSAGGNTLFKVEHSMFSTGRLSFSGNVGYNGDSAPATVLRAAYAHQFDNGTTPEFALTMRRFRTAPMSDDAAVLQALAFSAADTFNIMGVADVKLGAEYQTVDFLGRASALRPFASVGISLSDNLLLQYRYATSQPEKRLEKGFDTAPADLTESGPRMSLINWAPQIERAYHHEVSATRRTGANTFEFAVFRDEFHNPAMLGAGDVGPQANLFPDIYSGTFTVTGRDFSATGVRLSAHRKLLPNLTASLAWAWAGTLEAPPDSAMANVRDLMRKERRHSITARAAGMAPGTRTRWTASYKWSGGAPLLPLDMFNESEAQADPYLNLFLRQPIPDFSFLPSGMEALVDVRNLLAQGYVPVVASDGQTVYLVQSARAVRGGVAFKF